MKSSALIILIDFFFAQLAIGQTELWHIADSTFQSGYGTVIAATHNEMFVTTYTVGYSPANGLFKYDGNGNVIFRKLFSKPDCNTFYWEDEKVDKDGNLYIVGSFTDSIWNHHAYLTKIDSNGNQLWELAPDYSVYGIDFRTLVLDSFGNIYTAGYKNFMIQICKFDGDGNLIWHQEYGDSGASCYGGIIKLDHSNNIVVVGLKTGFNIGGRLQVLKYSNNGTLMWQDTMYYANFLSIIPQSISIDNNGNILTSGYITTGGYDPEGFPFATKFLVTGDSAWLRVLRPSSHHYSGGFFSGDLNSLGDYFCGGTDTLGNSFIIKLNSSGDEVWNIDTIPVLNLPYGQVRVVKVRGNFLYATCGGYGGTTNEDYLILAFDFDGNLKWHSLFNLPPSCIDDPISLDLDNDGNVLVSGNSIDSFNQNYVTTVKYSNVLAQIFPPEGNSDNFQLFPNPSSNQIAIISPHVPFRFKIFNTLGQILFEEETISLKISVNIEQWPAGIYFAEVSNNDWRVVKKFVKQ